MLLSLPEPYDFALSTERFRVFGIDRANLWHVTPEGRGGLHRVVAGREIRIEAAAGGVAVEPWTEGIGAVARTLLGASFDLAGFAAFARGDEVLARLIRGLAGFRPPLAPDPFEALVTSITAQQVSLQSAFAIRSRLIGRFGESAEHAVAFPVRERLAGATEPELVAVGFSGRKAEYTIALARDDLDLDALAALPDDEVKARLVALRGIGEWTADWFLARHLGRPHAWPAGDLVLRKAVRSFYGDVQDVRSFGARFHPYENLAAHYLLTGLRTMPPR
ncbi:MAG: DNA-3-methyladenine glycosylase 2 family protein [Actinobacteria bacterium]|nr:DNA-3-methyladenine glycosylase 2 family protein [Actinomycetota bacterium]